jgi:hypothetical protein
MTLEEAERCQLSAGAALARVEFTADPLLANRC